jgi:hypothetical protein
MPLGQLAAVQLRRGPPTIRTGNAQLVNYFYVDMHGRDVGGYVAGAQRAVAEQVRMPPGKVRRTGMGLLDHSGRCRCARSLSVFRIFWFAGRGRLGRALRSINAGHNRMQRVARRRLQRGMLAIARLSPCRWKNCP